MPESSLKVSLDLALSGKGAPPKAVYEQSLAATGEALDWLRAQYKSKSLELLQIPARTDDLKKAEALAKTIGRGMKTVAVLGIGGSSLGGQALTVLSRKSTQRAFVEFHDNPDPLSWRGVLKRVDKGLDIAKTHFICISKSGGTAETLAQALSAEAALKKAGVKNMAKHFTIITEPHKSPLADFADLIGAPKLDHPTGVGGRYSVLTVVGMLPALMMQLDARALRAGAQAVIEQTLGAKTPAEAAVARGAALHHALAKKAGWRPPSCGPMPTSWRSSAAGGVSCGRRAWARTARARPRCRCWVRWTSTASCNCSATVRAMRCSPS